MIEKLLTIKDVATRLGISYNAVYTLVNNRQIRYIPIGVKKYFREGFIEEFLESSKSKFITGILKPEKES